MRLWMKLTSIVTLAFGAVGFSYWAADTAQNWPFFVLGAGYVLVLVAMHLWLKPLSQITDAIERVAEGRLDVPALPRSSDEDMQRLSGATEKLVVQMRSLARQAEELAEGRIGVVEVEERVLRSGSLADAELPVRGAKGELERNFIDLTNQMRRLTIQARVIAQDHLYSPLLDERVSGELGDAFALMVRNLRALSDRAKDIAEGDLTSRVEGDGDLTSAFNQMVEGLKGLVEQITQTALHISSSAEQILAVLREQELAASHQASGVEETQRTMETLLSSAKKIAESAQTVFKSAEKTQANNRNVADRISELKSHTERIGEILEVIKSIADRSDLLALNASLEGMRAGEAGKGFTLVAAEMRRLAENIKESVSDIKELLSDIRESSLASVMATEEGSNLSEKTTESALKITLITQQQQSGTEQVTQSMEELSTLINHGVAGTRQVTTASSELVAMAENLRTLVETFRISSLPSSSGDYPAPISTVRKSSVPLKSKSRGARGAATQKPRRRLVETPVHLGGESSFVSTDQDRSARAASKSRGRSTGMFFSAERNEEPPTVEFTTGMSPEDEQELLSQLARASAATAQELRKLSGPSAASEAAESQPEAGADGEDEDADATSGAEDSETTS